VTTLLLIRHATTAATGKRLGGRTDAALDAAGRAQAEAAAARLADVPLKAVYSSPLRRTRETAELVAARRGLAVLPCEGVIEVDYGGWTDRPLGQLARTKRWGVIQARPSLVSFPEGETIRGMQARAVDAVEALVAAHPGDAIAVVSHADVIKALVAFYVGQPLDCFQRLHVGPASVTVLQLGRGAQPLLLRLGDDGPLEAARFHPPRRSRQKGRGRG
jgi:probable phosphomutase (TIGR03848 family)